MIILKLDSGKKIVCISSTDLTHYGSRYGFEPMGTGDDAIKWAILGEQLLTTADMTQKLRISCATLNRIRPQLIANGVKMVVVTGYPNYLESSVDKLILKCASEGRPMAPVPQKT